MSTWPNRNGRSKQTLVILNWRDLDHPQAGGAEVVCEELAARFAQRGEDVVLLAAHVDGLPRLEEKNGYRIVRRGSQFTVYPWALWWLWTHRQSIRAVIDSQNGIPFFAPLALPRRTPVILLLHHIHQEQFSAYFSAPMAAVGRWLERVACRWAYGRRAIVAVSPSTRSDARRILKLKGDIRVVPPGWNTTVPWNGNRRSRTIAPSIVCVGRLVAHKHIAAVIGAMPEIRKSFPTANLTLIGAGAEREPLLALVDELGLSDAVTLTGAVSAEERDALLSRSWLTINASQGEGWGLSILEANALGVPALAFRHRGLRDSIIAGQTGWLLEPKTDLADGIATALFELQDTDRAHDLSQAAREWAEHFTWDAMCAQFVHVMGSEAARLALPHPDRRVGSDLAMVVDIPEHALPTDWAPQFRAGDALERAVHGWTLHLPGADTGSVRAALARSGLNLTGARLRLRVARTSDYLKARVHAAGIARTDPAEDGDDVTQPDADWQQPA